MRGYEYYCFYYGWAAAGDNITVIPSCLDGKGAIKVREFYFWMGGQLRAGGQCERFALMHGAVRSVSYLVGHRDRTLLGSCLGQAKVRHGQARYGKNC